MKERKCLRPRKLNSVMKKFMNDACDLTYNRGSVPMDKAWQTEDGEWHWNEEDVVWDTPKKEIRLVKVNDATCAIINPYESVHDSAVGEIWYDIKMMFGPQLFCQYWREAFPFLKGFADVTLILLHELGHWETIDDARINFPIEARRKAMDELREMYSIILDGELFVDEEGLNKEYFELPDEAAASMWGITWLMDAEHRKTAKAFEKEFFACFAAM